MSNSAKKIGILTFHNSINNGAVMQAYSLSKKIQQDFPDCTVEIIDYDMKKVVDAYHYTFRRNLAFKNPFLLAKQVIKRMSQLDRNRKMNARKKVFASCRHYLPLSSFSEISDETENLFSYIKNHYDILVVGSDAVWNYVLRGFPNAYFPDSTLPVIKMSYAASCFGMEFLDCSEEERVAIGKILKDFSFLGVRDSATEDFVRWSGCEKTPIHVCDPTVFLDVDDLPIDVEALNTKLKKRGFDFERPTIGMMGDDKMLKMLRGMYGKKYQIVALYTPVKGADVNLYDLTPFEWAYVFRYFKLTVTRYFHGTLLSLRNGVPVISIALYTKFGEKHVSKVLDVLSRLGYESCYFETDYVEQNFEKIRNKANELMANDRSAEIIERMEKEATSYIHFREDLRKRVGDKND